MSETYERLRQSVREHRRNILRLSYETGKMHLGGDLSCAELMVTLFEEIMQIRPADPQWADRDRFVLSKGHGGGALYLEMARCGYFTMDEVFQTYRTGLKTRFGMHPCKAALPALDCSSGSLGHGLPLACGMALAGKMDKKPYRVFCLVGDGEMDEGSNWEAMLSAARFGLGNLVVIVDRNHLSLDGPTEELIPLEPFADKWRDFGWHVVEITDGNDIVQVVDALRALPKAESSVPTVVIAHTVKGKGVSYMENNPLFHNAAIDEAQYAQAIREIDGTAKESEAE
ncbi:transketolase [Agathobaculum sp. NTUH-O15-33]|uniref:transketolase n=1 Tax=Agathobaculum sp. NTUH-O15-33 TaxID=3079302 RepID=UPI0029583205|nr:transketolase [Agathobaculum sp. NTUH-O15-33]WNX85712.1 transketolase [Agathobaculum sp. NTUH-O15-33]